jgi:protein O-GlcNAc transferase
MPKAQGDPEGLAALRSAYAAWQCGDLAAAEADCRKAIGLGVDDARSWTLLGSIVSDRDPQAAEAALRRALERDRDFPDAHFQLGNLHRSQQRFDAAIESYRRTLALAPGNPSVMNNLALALDENGEAERALEAWQDSLRADPGHRQSQVNLAHALARAKRHREASALWAEHLRRFPDADAGAWAAQGLCLHHLGDRAGSERCFRRAIDLAPDDTSVLMNIAAALNIARDYPGAESIFARVVSLNPQQLYAMTELAHCRQHLCLWNGLPELHRSIVRETESRADGKALANPFTTLSIPMPAALQLRVARDWTKSRFEKAGAGATPPAQRAPEPGARLRLGYVSSDFRTHPIAALLTEVWERHDRERVETFAYSIGPRESSPLRDRIEAAFEHFGDCADESAPATAARIRNDRIDVLIDLNGHTAQARTEILALRPAPIQAHWLGYLGTMGADFIDYVITDRIATPPGEQADFDERFLYLDDCYCPSDTRREVSRQESSREENGLPPEGFVFCCFNNTYKVLPQLFDVWMRLLGAVEGSVLWLAPGNSAAGANLAREAAQRGIDPSRLVLASVVPLSRHLARHVHADLYLDTTPYNAGTTANDALLMGVPVLTTLGETMASRVAASQLAAIGMPELVAADLAAYEATALRLARHPEEQAALRARLRANRGTHPLFDMARFTRGLEDALARVAAR